MRCPTRTPASKAAVSAPSSAPISDKEHDVEPEVLPIRDRRYSFDHAAAEERHETQYFESEEAEDADHVLAPDELLRIAVARQ